MRVLGARRPRSLYKADGRGAKVDAGVGLATRASRRTSHIHSHLLRPGGIRTLTPETKYLLTLNLKPRKNPGTCGQMPVLNPSLAPSGKRRTNNHKVRHAFFFIDIPAILITRILKLRNNASNKGKFQNMQPDRAPNQPKKPLFWTRAMQLPEKGMRLHHDSTRSQQTLLCKWTETLNPKTPLNLEAASPCQD